MDHLWHLFNGFLIAVYGTVQSLPALAALGAVALMARTAERHLRPWFQAIGLLAFLAAMTSQPPVPILMAVVCAASWGTVRIDRFAPDQLRWRAAGGIALYGLAALAYTVYTGYLDSLTRTSWHHGLSAPGDAWASIAQGTGYINLIGVIGLYLVLPLGILALLVQSLLVHKPPSRTATDTISVLTGERRRERSARPGF